MWRRTLNDKSGIVVSGDRSSMEAAIRLPLHGKVQIQFHYTRHFTYLASLNSLIAFTISTALSWKVTH